MHSEFNKTPHELPEYNKNINMAVNKIFYLFLFVLSPELLRQPLARACVDFFQKI